MDATPSKSDSFPTTPVKKEERSLQGYIHSVSPVKQKEENNKKYFYCSIQTKEKSYRAVCFSPDKQSELYTMEKVKNPVQVKQFKLNDNQEILLDRFTQIKPLDKGAVEFQPVSFTKTGLIENIAALDNLASEQLVNLKAEVVHVYGVKQLEVGKNTKLRKQDVVVRDPSSSIKITLWEDHVESLEQNKTYQFKNLRLKNYNNRKYLNTPKSDEFTYEETDPFTQPLVHVEQDISYATSVTWKAKILGFQQASKQLGCISCNKAVVPHTDGVFGDCTACKTMQLLDTCQSSWVIKMLLQNASKPNEKRKVTFYHRYLLALMEKLNVVLDLNDVSDKEILMAIVKANKNVDITFDTITYRVTNVS